MPSPNPTVRRQHSGNAKTTTLSAPIVNGTDTSFTIVDATGWPDGSVGNFVATINAGQPDVEKILCSTRSGTTVNVATRGFEGTTAAGHATTATAAHTISATEIDEANQHTNATAGVHGVAGSVVGTSDSQTLTNKTISGASNTITAIPKASVTGAPTGAFVGDTDAQTLTNKTVNGGVLDGASTIGGVSGTSLAADRTAWTTYTPTFSNCTSPTGEFAYKVIGKSLFIRGYFTGGTVTATGVIKISLPVGVTLPGTSVQRCFGGSATVLLFTVSPTGANANLILQGDGTVGNQLLNVPFQGVFEIA